MLSQSIIDFIRAQFQTDGFIPLHAPVFKGKEKNYLLNTIDSTFVSSVGTYVDAFEEKMQQLTKTPKAVAVVNGTAALQVALRLAGVKAGDEVLTQALTFVATANAIAYNQAHPVFLDVDRDTMGLSPTALKNFLETNAEKRSDGAYNKTTQRRIAACLPMHTFGLMCRIEEIASICTEWNIPLIEDAAEALGSSANGKAAGSFGLLGTFSFNGNKIVTCGGGGAIVSNDVELGEKGKYLTTTAKVPHAWEYVHNELGYNFRMPNLNASLACAQLEQLDGFIAQKRKLFEQYLNFFSESGIQMKQPLGNTQSNHWLIALELPSRSERDVFLQETNAAGVMTRPIWQLMYRLLMYRDCQRDGQKNAEYLEDRIVNIPSSVIPT
jgi:aminotransferase in exopolysaccharide biosynthesis